MKKHLIIAAGLATLSTGAFASGNLIFNFLIIKFKVIFYSYCETIGFVKRSKLVFL